MKCTFPFPLKVSSWDVLFPSLHILHIQTTIFLNLRAYFNQITNLAVKMEGMLYFCSPTIPKPPNFNNLFTSEFTLKFAYRSLKICQFHLLPYKPNQHCSAQVLIFFLTTTTHLQFSFSTHWYTCSSSQWNMLQQVIMFLGSLWLATQKVRHFHSQNCFNNPVKFTELKYQREIYWKLSWRTSCTIYVTGSVSKLLESRIFCDGLCII